MSCWTNSNRGPREMEVDIYEFCNYRDTLIFNYFPASLPLPNPFLGVMSVFKAFDRSPPASFRAFSACDFGISSSCTWIRGFLLVPPILNGGLSPRLTISSTSSRFTCGWFSFCRGGSLSRTPLLKISSILFLEYE